MIDLQNRLLEPEQLDNLSLSGKPLEKTLRSLKFINATLGNHRQLSTAVLTHCKKLSNNKKITIIDLGCGGGDSLLYLSKKLKKNNFETNLIGIDGNPKSIAYAKKSTKSISNIIFKSMDILDPDFNVPNCDVLISSHFIYHFNDQQLITFIQGLKSQNLKHVIFSELYRSKVAFYLFSVLRNLLPISNIAKSDGLLAIRRAYTIPEINTIIKNAGIKDFEIHKKPFFRMIITLNL